MNLELYYKDNCPYSKKVLETLKRYDIGEDRVKKNNISGDADLGEELEKRGGKKQVPCLFIDDKPLYESSDIIEFLNERFA